MNDRACLIRNKGEKQGKLGQKKGEDKSEQQEVARKRFILHDRPQQRDQQIQPYDHVEKPQMIMPRDELGKHDRERRVTKDKIDERIAARPEEKDCSDARDVLFEKGGDADIAPEKQRAANHHKDGDRPFSSGTVEIEGKPRP